MTISIERTRFCIQPYEKGFSPTLEKRLSLVDWNTHLLKLKVFHIDEKTKTLFVPRGYSLHDTISALNHDNIYDIQTVDRSNDYIPYRKIKIDLRRGIAPRDEHQEEFIAFLSNIDTDETQKMLTAATGFGKTYCAIHAAANLGLPVMIITGKSALITQWHDVILQYTYCTENDIRIIKGRPSLEKTLKDNKHYKKFYICSTETIAIAAEEGIFDTLLKRTGVGIKIFDEAHELMSATVFIDLNSNVYLNWWLTATPLRSDTKEAKLYTDIIKTIPQIGGYTVFMDKFVHVKKIFINTYPNSWDMRKAKTRTGFSSLIYEKFIFRNPTRIQYFANIVYYFTQKLLQTDPDAKILVILASNNSITTLASKIETMAHTKVGRFNSLTKNMKEKQKELDHNIIFSTIKSAGAGLDISQLKMIINFVSFRSPIITLQLFGRLRFIKEKALFFIDIVDEGFADCLRLSNVRDGILRNKAKSLTTMNMTMKDAEQKAKGVDII